MQTTLPEAQPGAQQPAAEALCIGEAMVMLGADAGSLSESPSARLYVGGAEANVAMGLAHLGRNAEWFGRVGDDPFGVRIRAALAARGVDTSRVLTDPTHPTGVYFKEWTHEASVAYYYRSRSAATRLSAGELDDLALETRRLCHVSGITPALSPSCDAAIGTLLLERERGRLTVSFDVNHRPKLWDIETAAPRLLELARGADIVFVGRDEAKALWGAATAHEVRALLPGVSLLVVKDAAVGVTEFDGPDEVFVPALSVDVVEAIGAGDAFAAGYLAAWLDGAPAARRLRLGHVMAAHVLGYVGDNPLLPPRWLLRELADLDDEAWAAAHLARPDEHPHAAGRPRPDERQLA